MARPTVGDIYIVTCYLREQLVRWVGHQMMFAAGNYLVFALGVLERRPAGGFCVNPVRQWPLHSCIERHVKASACKGMLLEREFPMYQSVDHEFSAASEATIFRHVQRNLDSMLDDRPDGTSEAGVIQAAIEQLAARLAYEGSREDAALYLGGTTRSLRRGRLLRM